MRSSPMRTVRQEYTDLPKPVFGRGEALQDGPSVARTAELSELASSVAIPLSAQRFGGLQEQV